MEEDLTLQRDNRTVPIAKEILKIIASKEDLMIGSHDGIKQEDVRAYYGTVYERDIAPLLITHNVRINDIHYIFQLCMMALENVKGMVEHTIPVRMEQADSFLWNVKDMDDVTIGNVMDVLEKKFSTAVTATQN